jgi:acyl-CoA synthetase (AMP-forming)/AMP-acid ligase II
VIGASAISPDKLLEAVRIFGPCININYSQIESGFVSWLDAPIIAAAVAGDHPERIRSSGQSLCVSMIAIMADNGSLVGSGIVGEIVVRGRAVKPFIVTPYLLDVDEITASGRFGWHHTGDLGLMDVDGYLYVIGRLKDNIIVGGFKVSAGEVETVIMEIQEVAECAVFAVPDAIRGEVVKAVVSVRPGCSVTTKAISSHCRERLSRLKCPSVIELRSDLPKTPVGKVDKLRIRNESITPGLAD